MNNTTNARPNTANTAHNSSTLASAYSSTDASFNFALKHWRKHRKMSQLELALAADVSQRHLSWLETGRSQPSRDMIIKLSEAMDVPLRDRNQFLKLAGYASLYQERDLQEPVMEPVIGVLKDMLRHHEPYPAFVLDRQWNIKMKNQAADTLFNIMGDPDSLWQDIGDAGEKNIALLTVHPKGLRRFISNWSEVAPPFIQRLKKEAMESGSNTMLNRVAQLEAYVNDSEIAQDSQSSQHQELLPILPLEIDLGGPVLKLCSVISTFGTAQDITANELRIEAFYPADETTRKFFTE